MIYQSGKPILKDLTRLASTQGGYFTAQQAAALGYDRRRLAYHVTASNFERAGYGLYRIPELPLAEHDDLIRAAFWSRGRDDEPSAVVSHQTALAIHGLSDLFAEAIHLTVPPGFRKRAPKGWVLHKADLSPADVQDATGFRLTTPLRTLTDIAADDSISIDHLRQAITEALDRGMVTRKKLEAAARHLSPRLAEALDRDQ